MVAGPGCRAPEMQKATEVAFPGEPFPLTASMRAGSIRSGMAHKAGY